MSSLIQEPKTNSDPANQQVSVELQAKPVQFKKQSFEFQGENYKLKVESHEPKERNDLQTKINFNTKMYFCYGDAVPFCPNCKKKQSLLIHLAGPRQIENGYIYNCPVCKKEY
jgi:hypothetical protein